MVKAHQKGGLIYQKKAYAIFIKEKSPYPIISSSLNLADAYLTLQQPTEAKKWLDQAQYVIDTARSGDYHQRDNAVSNLYPLV